MLSTYSNKKFEYSTLEYGNEAEYHTQLVAVGPVFRCMKQLIDEFVLTNFTQMEKSGANAFFVTPWGKKIAFDKRSFDMNILKDR